MTVNEIASLLHESEREWTAFRNNHRNGSEYDCAELRRLFAKTESKRIEASENIRNWLAYHEGLLEFIMIMNECPEEIRNAVRDVYLTAVLRYANRFGMDAGLAARISRAAKEKSALVSVVTEDGTGIDARNLMDVLEDMKPGESFSLVSDVAEGAEAVREMEELIFSLAATPEKGLCEKDRFMDPAGEIQPDLQESDPFRVSLLQAGADPSLCKLPFENIGMKELYLQLCRKAGDTFMLRLLQQAIDGDNQPEIALHARRIRSQAKQLGYRNVFACANNLFLCTALRQASAPCSPPFNFPSSAGRKKAGAITKEWPFKGSS